MDQGVRSIGRGKLLRIGFLLLLFMLVLSLTFSAAASPASRARGTTTIKVLVRGAPIHGTNGVAFDQQNRLHIASALGREIVVMDPKSGRILDRLGPADGVAGPDDLTFGPDGTLYWTDILSGEVGRRTTDDQVKKQWVAPFVNPITLADDGRLFVAQAFVADGLFEIDSDLEAPPSLILGSGNPNNHLNAFDFGPDGKLYAPNAPQNRLVMIDVDADPVTMETFLEDVEGAVKFDAQGIMHLLDGNSETLLRFDSETPTVLAHLDPGTDNMAFDANGAIYVSNFRDGSIHEVLPSGQMRQVSRGGLVLPGGIAVLPDGHAGESLFVADWWSIRQFDGRTGKPGMVDNDFFFDAPVSASADGENVILTSWFGNSVTVWSPEGPTKLEVHFGFGTPLNAIRFQGDLVVAEMGPSFSGRILRQEGQTGDRTVLLDEGIFVPTGLAANEDNLWVADWAAGMIWQLVADGVALDPPQATAAGLVQPEGMVMDHDGSLLVVEAGAGRLLRIDPMSGEVQVVAEGLGLGAPAAPGWPPTWVFNGVTVGERGDIYVTGDIANVIYRLRERP